MANEQLELDLTPPLLERDAEGLVVIRDQLTFSEWVHSLPAGVWWEEP